jgi:environmental stress-induced protein Ves
MAVQPALQPIRQDGLAITPWKNGTGRKADIVSGPGWTVAYAWLDGDSTFSDYSGHERTITLTEGPGFELFTPDGTAALRVEHLFAPAAFDGGLSLTCRIAGAPCRVVNVMTERGRWNHSVEIVGETGGRIEPAARGGGPVILVVLQGDATVTLASGPIELGRYDALDLTDEAHIAPSPMLCVAVFRIVPRS